MPHADPRTPNCAAVDAGDIAKVSRVLLRSLEHD